MIIQDILNFFLIFGLLTFIVCSIIVTYFLVLALKAMTDLAEDLKETTQGFRNKMGLKFLSVIPSVFVALLGKIIKRGR